jgi:hypothetical protein
VVLQWFERALELLADDSEARLSVLATTYVRVEVGAMVARVVGGVAFLLWIYRAAQRAHEQGRKGLTLSPGWCVACFFVPVAMLFVPYQAMSGIATAADPQERGHAPGHVFVWWATYLASLGLVAFGGNSFVVGADLGVELVATALSTGALVALWATMRFIRRGQAHWAAHDAARAATKPRKRRRV